MPKLLIIGYVWPEPNSSAAGSRMMQLIAFFIAENYEVVFATTAVETPHMVNLTEFGVKSEAIELNNSSFDDFVKELQPDVVLFDRFMMEEQFGWRISEVSPHTMKILDTEDLHFLRKARHEVFQKQKNMTPALLQSEMAKREISSIYRCDISLIISEFEKELLLEEFQVPGHILFELPFMFDQISSEAKEKLPAFEQRNHFVSIGNFRHLPNWDAVLFLKQKIWPLIKKKLPDAELHIYGAYPPPKAMQLHNPKEGFLVKGWAKNSGEVIKNARVLLAPLRFGAGLKGKLAEAMQCGTPTVTTSMGAEGMKGNMDWNGFIEDHFEAFAAKAVHLFQNRKSWQQAQENGFRILENKFSKSKNQQTLEQKISETIDQLENHRIKNFTGSMLQHHQHMSTKYLSKYIEVKNRKAD